MSQSTDLISKTTIRRFILGRQGLWPGRRWSGREGTAVALKTVEAVQIDPVVVVAQSHNIVLWGRVLNYQPADLQDLCNVERLFFDFGGSLFIYPMTELPYWRHVMARVLFAMALVASGQDKATNTSRSCGFSTHFTNAPGSFSHSS